MSTIRIDPETGLPLLPNNTTILPPEVPFEQQTNIFPNGFPAADDPELTVDTGAPLVDPASMPAPSIPLQASLNPNAVPTTRATPEPPKTVMDSYMDRLTKTQRRVLGFAALADAGAALRGQDTNNYGTQLQNFISMMDMDRKREAELARQSALAGLTNFDGGLGAGGAPDDMLGQLRARKQQLLATAFQYPSLASSIALSISDIDKQIEQIQQNQVRDQDTAMGASTVLNTVEELSQAVKENPNMITGPIGMILGVLPFTEAGEARLTTETLRANLAFDALKNIKASGATLGSVSAPELALLEAKVANLNLNRGSEAVLKSLEEIDRYYKQLVVNAYNRADDPSQLDAIFGGRPRWATDDVKELKMFTFENAELGELVVDTDEDGNVTGVFEFLGGDRDDAASWKPIQF